MNIRPALVTGGSLALGVLALGAVQSGLPLAMTPGRGTTPAGWTPMPDPAGGGVVSPPFPANLTAEERAHLETFDALDFEVFSNQDWARLAESHAQNIRVHFPDGHYTDGIEKHIADMSAWFEFAPDMNIKVHPLRLAKDNLTAVMGVLKGTFSKPMPDGQGGTIAPTGRAFAVDMVTVGIWNRRGTMDEEFLFWITEPSTAKWEWPDPMRIDVHAHYWTEDYLDQLADLGKTDTAVARGLGAGDGAELDARLRLMDRAGVQMQVLSACPQEPYVEDAQKAAKAARFVNDQYAGLVQRHPDRFAAFAALPMPHVPESIGEMRRALDELGMAGIALNTSIAGHALVEPGYEPVFAELNARSAVLYLHPAGNGACSPLISNYHLTWMIGAPIEDTISIMQLITKGIPTRYPDIKIINSHLGGALPMLLQRADDQYRWEAPETPERPSVAARRMRYDTVGHGYVPALRCAIDSFGADRLLLGTDFPYENGDIFVRAIEYISDPRIDPDDARAILDHNASALLGIG